MAAPPIADISHPAIVAGSLKGPRPMTDERQLGIFSLLYLASSAVLVGWFVLLLVGLTRPNVMALATEIALPTLLGSILCLEGFRRLARRAEKRLRSHKDAVK